MKFTLNEADLDFSPIRASGPGGQHVNKVSSAVVLRFDVPNSDLPSNLKSRILELRDRRISKDGLIVIKAQRFRSQDKNKQDAVARLYGLVEQAAVVQKVRIETRPGRGAKERRLKDKKQHSNKKASRRVSSFD